MYFSFILVNEYVQKKQKKGDSASGTAFLL